MALSREEKGVNHGSVRHNKFKILACYLKAIIIIAGPSTEGLVEDSQMPEVTTSKKKKEKAAMLLNKHEKAFAKIRERSLFVMFGRKKRHQNRVLQQYGECDCHCIKS